MDTNRTVHGFTSDGTAIVRYERGGHWYLEPKTGARRKITIAESAREATSGKALLGQPGGTIFDARVRRARTFQATGPAATRAQDPATGDKREAVTP